MKHPWKKLFWISLIILVISNLFWLYKTVDISVGHNYYEESCDGYYKDMTQFKKILDNYQTKRELIDFLESNHVRFDSIQKGSDFIVTFNSFSITFDKNGKQEEKAKEFTE